MKLYFPLRAMPVDGFDLQIGGPVATLPLYASLDDARERHPDTTTFYTVLIREVPRSHLPHTTTTDDDRSEP